MFLRFRVPVPWYPSPDCFSYRCWQEARRRARCYACVATAPAFRRPTHIRPIHYASATPNPCVVSRMAWEPARQQIFESLGFGQGGRGGRAGEVPTIARESDGRDNQRQKTVVITTIMLLIRLQPHAKRCRRRHGAGSPCPSKRGWHPNTDGTFLLLTQETGDFSFAA